MLKSKNFSKSWNLPKKKAMEVFNFFTPGAKTTFNYLQ